MEIIIFRYTKKKIIIDISFKFDKDSIILLNDKSFLIFHDWKEYCYQYEIDFEKKIKLKSKIKLPFFKNKIIKYPGNGLLFIEREGMSIYG